MQHVSSRNIARTPEKGVFPLDHFNECKHLATDYLGCLNKEDFDAAPCREISKHYLQCRMSRALMAKQNLSELGFFGEADDAPQAQAPVSQSRQAPQQQQQKQQASSPAVAAVNVPAAAAAAAATPAQQQAPQHQQPASQPK